MDEEQRPLQAAPDPFYGTRDQCSAPSVPGVRARPRFSKSKAPHGMDQPSFVQRNRGVIVACALYVLVSIGVCFNILPVIDEDFSDA